MVVHGKDRTEEADRQREAPPLHLRGAHMMYSSRKAPSCQQACRLVPSTWNPLRVSSREPSVRPNRSREQLTRSCTVGPPARSKSSTRLQELHQVMSFSAKESLAGPKALLCTRFKP